MTGLFGIQAIPPDIAVEPPTRSCFSSTRASAPAEDAARAATRAPPPDPTMTRSAASSQLLIVGQPGGEHATDSGPAHALICSSWSCRSELQGQALQAAQEVGREVVVLPC